jgi:RHS repeat-associated protein
MIMNIKKIVSISFCAILLANAAVLAQKKIIIDETIQANDGVTKEYIISKSLRLQPATSTGFKFTASSSESFVLRLANPDGSKFPQGPDKNFVRTESVLISGITQETSLKNLSVDQKSTTYGYLDGVGRSIQTVNVKASPAQRDMVSFSVFDGFGRQKFSYLPYTANGTTGAFRSSPDGEQKEFYKNPPTGVVAEIDGTFSENTFEESPLNRTLSSQGPGLGWFTASKKVENKTILNAANDVFQWIYNEPDIATPEVRIPPTLQGYYSADLLVIGETKDENGLIKRVYKNFLGQTVLERVSDGTVNHDTYYIYDFEGNAYWIIPPQASLKATEPSGGIPHYNTLNATTKETFLNDWIFQYNYDAFNRVTGKKIPGADWVYMVYDKWDRLVLSQDGKLKASGQWSFTKYDIFNRAIITGFYSSNADRSSLQNEVNNNFSDPTDRYEIRDLASSIGYTLDKTFPVNPSESNMLTISYYDDHDFRNYPGWDAEGKSYTYIQENGLPASDDLPATVKGYTTGSKVKKLGSSQWLNNITYYDKKYSVIQVTSENHLNGTDRISSQIDFAGRAKAILRTHNSSIDNFTLLEENEYDHSGRLLRTYHTMGGGLKVLIASNTYNELGQLIEKNIHSVAGSAPLQSVDYRYNIRGWLTNINNGSLTADANNNDTNDLFGMELFYNNTAPQVNGVTPEALYGGNISAIRWKSTNLIDPPKEKVFGFTYDKWSRLLDTKYAVNNNGTFNGDAGLYDNSYGYDRNGNINSLVRWGSTASGKQKIDNLSYDYMNGNRLKYVNDLQTSYSTPGTKGYGFTENSNITVAEYLYDQNGNVKGDMNKGIDVIYNHLNMPSSVTFAGGSIQYTYDALGNKLKQVVTKGSTVIAERDYIGGVHYENGKLAFVVNKEGRAIKDGSNWFYEYQLRDHQNNTMVSFGSLEESNVYKATMETSPSSVQTTEESQFRNVANRRDNYVNRTQATAAMPLPIYSVLTNGGVANKEIGPAKILPVNSGDRLKMEVYVRYVTPGSGAAPDVLGNLVALTTGALGISSGETAYAAFNNNLPAVTNTVTANSLSPKIYLNYILFNSSFTGIPQFGYSPVSTTAAATFEKLSMEITVPPAFQGGTAYIYVTNESNYPAYVDDMTIVHEKTNLVPQVTQQTDYYPFGVSFNTYVKEAITPNRYLYQGQEHQDDLGFEEYQYKYRLHDPTIGRFMGVDPLAEKYMYNSSYAFSENIVINGIELEGAEKLTTIDKFSYSDNYAMNAITVVDNSAINLLNGGIGIWNSGVSTFQMLGNEGFSGYWNSLSNDLNSLGNAFTESLDANIKDIKSKSASEIFIESIRQFGKAQNYENAVSLGVSLATTKNFAFNSSLSQFNKAVSFMESNAGISPAFITPARGGGRLGNAATRSQIDNIATTLESRGYTITGGGGRAAEEFLKPLGGGRKGGSFLDITATHPNYPTLRINTVDVYKSNLPTLRELNNATRIRTQIAPGEHLLLIPKR